MNVASVAPIGRLAGRHITFRPLMTLDRMPWWRRQDVRGASRSGGRAPCETFSTAGAPNH
jgi:hypothetical protein